MTLLHHRSDGLARGFKPNRWPGRCERGEPPANRV
jgi:hypothetical protein